MTSQSISDSETAGARRRLDRAMVRRLAKFGLVGGSGVVVNVVIFELVLRLALPALGLAGGGSPSDESILIANFAGVVVSIFTNFVFNDRWTWGDRAKGGSGHWIRRLGKYYALASAAAAIQLAVTWASYTWGWRHLGLTWELVDLQAILPVDPRPTLALLTGIACGMIVNFLASHLWAFRDVEPTE